MSIELKIKAKHLAFEPGIIRCEERRLKAQIKYLKKKSLEDINPLSHKLNSLIVHRRWDVCNESRATHLARTYLDNKPYMFAEKKRKQDREWIFQRHIIPRIVAMIKKYGTLDQQKIDEKSIQKWSSIEVHVL